MKIYVRGSGNVQVTRMPKRIPKMVMVAEVMVSGRMVSGKAKPITKQNYLEAWALSHRTGERYSKSKFRRMLAERVTFPRATTQSLHEKYAEAVGSQLGFPVDYWLVATYHERGIPASEAADIIKRKRSLEEGRQKR